MNMTDAKAPPFVTANSKINDTEFKGNTVEDHFIVYFMVFKLDGSSEHVADV